MVDEANDDVTTPSAFDAGVGPYLREAREKAGIRIEDIATDTRIPLRHLKAIEASDYSGLPGKTYATGFVRAYARSLGLDEAETVAHLRKELGTDDYRAGHQYEAYEPADPSRVPTKLLAWTAAIVAIALMAAWGVMKSGALSSSGTEISTESSPENGGTDTVAPTDLAPGTTPAATAPVVADNAEVVIAAKDTVWFRIDDATGKRIHEAELKTGERYVVPTGTKGLTIRTSRPQAMTISVAGQAVPQLGEADTLVKNISLDPTELAKRIASGGAANTPAPAATSPAPTAAPSAAPKNSDPTG